MSSNGNKYINYQTFWPIIAAVFIAMGVIGTFLFERQDKQADKIDILQSSMVQVQTDVGWIRDFFENKLNIQNIINEKVAQMVQKQFEIIPDERYATPADRLELATSSLKGE